MLFYFLFNDTATTEIYTYCHTLSLHDALPISTSALSTRSRTFEILVVSLLADFRCSNSNSWASLLRYRISLSIAHIRILRSASDASDRTRPPRLVCPTRHRKSGVQDIVGQSW